MGQSDQKIIHAINLNPSIVSDDDPRDMLVLVDDHPELVKADSGDFDEPVAKKLSMADK